MVHDVENVMNFGPSPLFMRSNRSIDMGEKDAFEVRRVAAAVARKRARAAFQTALSRHLTELSKFRNRALPSSAVEPEDGLDYVVGHT